MHSSERTSKKSRIDTLQCDQQPLATLQSTCNPSLLQQNKKKTNKQKSLLHVHDTPMTKIMNREKEKLITKHYNNLRTHGAKVPTLGFIHSCIQAIHPPHSIIAKGKNTTAGLLHNIPD